MKIEEAELLRRIQDSHQVEERTMLRAIAVREAMDCDGAASTMAEFGVWKGSSLRDIAMRAPRHRVIGFDSFFGLPIPWVTGGKNHPAGHFTTGGSIPSAMPPNVSFVVGEFCKTLPFLEQNLLPGRPCFALVHIDSDLYESCVEVLRFVTNRLVYGSVLLFDELCDFGGKYPNWQHGEWKALCEWLPTVNLHIAPIGRTKREQVAFRVETPDRQE